MGLFIWRNLQINGGRTLKVLSGTKNGGNITMQPAKQRNGLISGAA